MNSDFIINYSWWSIILVLFCGFLFAGFLYFKNKKNKLSVSWTIVLFIFRFLAVSSIAFLLLNPFFKTQIKKLEKPIIIIGLDNSKSIVSGKDSIFLRKEFPIQFDQLVEDLSAKYKVDTYLFGNETRLGKTLNFSDETSDYAEFISQIKEDYQGQNIGALVLAGDGISNRGIDPEYAASTINYPIYTIAFGDTIQNKDIRINEVSYNSLAYSGDVLPFRINVAADRFTGEKANIVVNAFGKQQFSKEIIISEDSFNQSFDFSIKAENSGKQRVNISIQTNSDEVSLENNRRNIFVDIIDTKKKILLLANAPHPDLSAIQSSIEQSGNYSLVIQYPEKLKEKLDDFDLIIIHQLPSSRQTIGPLLADATAKKIPLLYILGKQSNLIQFNQNFKGVNIISVSRNFEDAQADINSLFSFFHFDKDAAGQMENLPPLLAPVGKYQLMQGAEVFAFQKIRNISTDIPLVMFYTESEIKKGVITGEGLWLWRMHNYLREKNYEAFDNFINKAVQYLVARKDKRFFKVTTKGEYGSQENVRIRAELFDPSYKPVNNSEVSLKLINESGEQFNHVFSPEGNSYLLDLKILPEGIYRFTASSRLGSENYNETGEFIVNLNSLESRTLNADHSMLFRLASQHNGKMIFQGQVNQLPDLLQENELKSKIYYEEKYTGLKDLFIILAFIILLLSLEWFLRKYFGSY